MRVFLHAQLKVHPPDGHYVRISQKVYAGFAQIMEIAGVMFAQCLNASRCRAIDDAGSCVFGWER